MKTKKFFMLLAAMLLMSASAMAQSGNSEPIRGDLNGDGEVNMSDVMFLVQKILNGKFPDEGEKTYYWYVGTEQPMAVNDPVAWRTTTSDAGFTIQPNVSSSDKIWVAYPNTWTLEVTDADGYTTEKDYLSSSIKNSINGYLVNRFTADSNTSSWTFEFIK